MTIPSVRTIGSRGCFWSASQSSTYNAFYLSFYSSGLGPQNNVYYRYCGLGLRLVSVL